MFINKRILIVSPESWNHLFVSKHHYAILLSKSNLVYFLNPPSKHFQIAHSEYPNLFILDYTPFPKGLRFYPSFIQKFFMKKKIKELQEVAHVQFDCIWSFDNSVFFDFSFLNPAILKISHIVDYSQDFQSSRAAATAQICFGVSQNIVDRQKKINQNSFLIPHGISVESESTLKVELPGKNKIKALYAGNLNSQYLDRKLLAELVNTFKQIDFIFLGSGKIDGLENENLYQLKAVHHSELFSYLRQADVLLLAYDVKSFSEQVTNAHKILEYLNSGKIIVSTPLRDYKQKGDLLLTADNHEDFLKTFNEVITNLDFYNQNEKQKVRIEYASKNSYATRLDEIESLIISCGLN